MNAGSAWNRTWCRYWTGLKGSGNEPHHQGKLRIDEITRIRTWEGDTWISFDPEPDFYFDGKVIDPDTDSMDMGICAKSAENR